MTNDSQELQKQAIPPQEQHGGHEEPEVPATPPPKRAELIYSDYAALRDQAAADLAADLELMAPVDGRFSPDAPVSRLSLIHISEPTRPY